MPQVSVFVGMGNTQCPGQFGSHCRGSVFGQIAKQPQTYGIAITEMEYQPAHEGLPYGYGTIFHEAIDGESAWGIQVSI